MAVIMKHIGRAGLKGRLSPPRRHDAYLLSLIRHHSSASSNPRRRVSRSLLRAAGQLPHRRTSPVTLQKISAGQKSPPRLTSPPVFLSSLESKASALEALLKNPIHFVPATHLTAEDEAKMAVLRPRKVVRKHETAAQARRRTQTQHISKSWNSAYTGQGAKGGPLSSQGMPNDNAAMCYRRSTMQALMHVPMFVNWLEQKHQSGRCMRGGKSCLACQLRLLKEAYWQRSGPGGLSQSQHRQQIYRAVKALDVLCRKVGWRHPSSEQQDAQEFLLWMLDTIREQLPRQAEEIDSMFCIEFESSYKCPNRKCKHVSRQPPMKELQMHVPLQPKQPSPRLTSYLKPFFKEVLPEVRCSKCNDRSDKERELTISLAPEVLILPVKRFAMNDFGRLRKVQTAVDICEWLDLSKYASELEQRVPDTLRYRLISVVQHSGSLHGGHYISVAKGPHEMWRTLNDEMVSKATISDAINPGKGWTPYILTYVRVDKLTANHSTELAVDRRSSTMNSVRAWGCGNRLKLYTKLRVPSHMGI
ncbi:cysteine proteinase [Xylona heveae TC161]|uniref:ubiquitinyl hydrolase 1 n=1 Tax=Xylona heveae (strain CBS 132557 / TC161) TaxID=1328760 RepID=A0A165F8K5_XYLHT|nr:cysteine proteinase [Xylona heveae TC161]KZF20703.1 cysteine proteinase [Xylona heveae TC161]